MPPELRKAQRLREPVQAAQERLAQDHRKRVNPTDGDADLMKGRWEIVPSYNAQAIVSPAGAGEGQLAPMLEEAETMAGVRSEVVLADGGYFSGPGLEAAHEREQRLVAPAQVRRRDRGAYFKDQFVCDTATDTYRCPEDQVLYFSGMGKANGKTPVRIYRALQVVCHACPA